MGCRLEAARLEKVTSPTRTSADEEGDGSSGGNLPHLLEAACHGARATDNK